LGDDVNTDYIIASRYKAQSDNLEGLVAHLFEDLDPTLASRIEQGDIVVAGHNFGSGSSRETAPRVLRASGVRVVVARSFARIFFRNSINIGLAAIECDWEGIEDGQGIEIDLDAGRIAQPAGSTIASFEPLPAFLQEILMAGGIREKLRASRR
jgi:3-isopropylmalate/(R)-2-methylmalate dehydratase small subunit